MDEILRAPQEEFPLHTQRKGRAPSAQGGREKAERAGERFRKLMEAGAAQGRVFRLQGIRVYHRTRSAVAGRPKMAPLPFLALTAVIGIAAVVGTMYTPAYVVTVDGVDVGLVRDQSVFRQAVERVEERASDILGYDYHLAHEVSYEMALTGQDQITPAAEFETYLFDQIGEELNPGVDINKLYIGQILNIKEEIPFLGVQTVDSLTYHEEIACEVREVEDDSMYQGESKVLDAGIPGEALVTADVTYVNGVEKERNVTSTTVLREATEKVIAVGTKERPTWYPTGNYIWPVYGRITSRFGYRSIFGSYSYHSGLDIAVPYGTSVKASDGGTVTFAGYKGSYGYLVIINHGNGEQTYYGHNSSLLVSAGDKVYQGQTIAKAGSTGRSTGSHCHFEIRINGTAVNPAAYLN